MVNFRHVFLTLPLNPNLFAPLFFPLRGDIDYSGILYKLSLSTKCPAPIVISAVTVNSRVKAVMPGS